MCEYIYICGRDTCVLEQQINKSTAAFVFLDVRLLLQIEYGLYYRPYAWFLREHCSKREIHSNGYDTVATQSFTVEPLKIFCNCEKNTFKSAKDFFLVEGIASTSEAGLQCQV